MDEVIRRATAKNPSDRYTDALSLAVAFESAIFGPAMLIERDTITPIDVSLASRIDITPILTGAFAPSRKWTPPLFFGRQALIEQTAGPHLTRKPLSGSGRSQRQR